jgi:hypothetical protein
MAVGTLKPVVLVVLVVAVGLTTLVVAEALALLDLHQ